MMRVVVLWLFVSTLHSDLYTEFTYKIYIDSVYQHICRLLIFAEIADQGYGTLNFSVCVIMRLADSLRIVSQ